MARKRQKVVVVGGGVGGLTAAHELIERDFDVVVYDRRDSLGGKAASVRVPAPPEPDAQGARPDGGATPVGRPGEHGFRFFPGWYRHLPDTLRRIPVRGHRDWPGEQTVFDHLVPTERNLLTRYDQDPVPVVIHSPKNRDQVKALGMFLRQLSNMGLPLSDVTLFLAKLATFLRTPEERRKREYDAKSWWAFLEADRRSDAFRTLTVATTRTLVAAKAEEASAYTIALLAVRTLFDAPLSSDCVLDGPTNEVWIDPWVRYLEGRGVVFRRGYELDSIQFDGNAPRIESLSFVSSRDQVHIRQLRDVLAAPKPEDARKKFAVYASGRSKSEPQYVRPNVEGDDLKALHRRVADELGQMAPDHLQELDADYYVMAIPVEQMAYYVSRSTSATSYAPKLRDIVVLSASVDWMAGIQFYLKYPLNIAPGHIVCADSEWALTAIEQTQFWKDVELPADVQSVLSVDISAWDKKGRFHRKEAFLCTKDEIATEVWEQMKASLNRAGEQNVLRDASLVNGAVSGSFHVDDNIVERYDRKKQAAFARGADRALNNMAQTALASDELLSLAERTPDAPFVFGDRLEINVEPLLVNRPGSLARRPAARTKIENMFLAADYVDTATNLACMEGANEAARRAVNGILDTAGSRYERCKTWRFEDGEVLARIVALLTFAEHIPGARTSLEAAAGAASTLGAFAARASANVKQMWRGT